MEFEKHTYTNKGALNFYNSTHEIPDRFKEKISKRIISKLTETEINKKEDISILDCGIGQGNDFLLPFINELIKRILRNDQTSINKISVFGFDNSLTQLKKLRLNFEENFPSGTVKNNCSESFEYHLNINNKLEICFHIFNFDFDYEYEFFENNKFDIVFAFYILHHLLNWRMGVIKILNCLVENGTLFLSERCGDYSFFSGKLNDSDNEILSNIFRKYSDIRNEEFYWDPEITACDYKDLINFISPFFDVPSDYSKIISLNIKKEKKISEIKKWIEEKVFSYFWTGPNIPKNRMDEIFNDPNLPEKVQINDNIKIYPLTKFKKFHLNNIDYWMTRSILKKINNLMVYDIRKLIGSFVHLLIQNCFFLQSTKFMSLHTWDVIKNKWVEPIEIQINTNQLNDFQINEFIKNYLAYMKFTYLTDFSMNKLIFKDLIKKKAFKFVFCGMEAFDIIEDESCIIFKIPQKYINKIKFNLNGSAASNIDNYITEKTYNLRGKVINFTIDQDIQEILESYQIIQHDINLSNIEQKIRESVFFKTLVDENSKSEVIEKLPKTIIGLASFFINSDRQVLYYEPSQIIMDEKNEKSIGFGGLIRFDDFSDEFTKLNLQSSFLPVLKMLFKKRNDLLYLMTNIVFSKVGVINWAEKARFDVLREKIFSAIISILVDSYAHNISAHSLTALKWWFENRVSDFDKRIYIGTSTSNKEQISSLKNLQPSEITNLNEYAKKSHAYYKVLGLDDSSNDERYTSLLEILKLVYADTENKFLTYEAQNENEEIISNYGFPIPIDHGILKFIKFLRNKSAFWSGVIRDLPFGGEVKNLYDVLWKDFADNPLYLGTIANSEGINRLIISIEFPKCNDNHFEKKEFVKIDMSLMNRKNTDKSDDYTKVNYEQGENGSKYSKYALVFPGKDHCQVREKLQENHYDVFFPGGVIGEHALFTIFENTIRNIKHFHVTDDMKEKGLNFTIRISPAKLMDEGMPKAGDQEHKLFKITPYIDHENRLFEFEANEEEKKFELIKITEKLEDMTKESVVDKNGSPRLGGNSQDKICAAMLLNNRFISVDPNLKQEMTGRDKYYYGNNDFYWIGFEDTVKEREFQKLNKESEEIFNKELKKLDENTIETFMKEQNINDGISSLTVEKKNKLFLPYFNKYIRKKIANKIDEDIYKGKLLKYFYLWKGDFIYSYSDIDNLKDENISRFKFIYIDENEIDNKLAIELLQLGVIRVLCRKDFDVIREEYNKYIQDLKSNTVEDESNRNLANTICDLVKKIRRNKNLCEIEKYFIYMAWLYKLIDNRQICFLKCPSESPDSESTNECNFRINNYQHRISSAIDNDKDIYRIYFRHSGRSGGIDESKILDFRSHGWMRENIFSDDDFNLYNSNGFMSDELPIFEEFIEILSTKVCIIDNRVYDRISLDIKRKKYKDLLNLNICKEFDVKNNLKEKKKWVELKEGIKNREYNFVIAHLSFIESLDCSEENIDDFFAKELQFEENIPDKFYLIITTGRGRSRWNECISEKYKKVTFFKPIEMILDAVEQALSLKDDIQLKYNLTKIIYGS
jgi:hypothetical protein